MKNLLIFLTLCFICETTFAHNQNDEAAIEVVIENFKKGIIEKDSVLLNSLFFANNTPVIGVMSVPTEKSIQQKNPNFQGLTVSDSKRFIEEICTSTTVQQEIFANTNITITERIATVSFLYAFSNDNEIYQWGQEN